MNASQSVPWRTRKAVAAAAVAVGVAGAMTAYAIAGEDVAATDSGTSTEFEVVGNGDLPTKKPALGQDRDPLSAEETGYAIHVASTDASVPDDATDVLGEEGPEFLYADLPEVGEDYDGRIAVVSLYDYTHGVAYDQTVDLAAGKVVESVDSKVAQPPTSATEADVAMQLAIESDKDLAFKDEFEAGMGVPLIGTDQVEYVAGAWVFNETTPKGQECGKDRCAQLMVSTATGNYLNTWDFVVNLSTKKIVRTQ